MSEIGLNEVKEGERGIVKKITGPSEMRKRIMDMGVVRGTEIEVVRSAPLGDPVELLLRGYNLSLRKMDAKNVYVEVR